MNHNLILLTCNAVNNCKQMSKTVSARITSELHEELRDRCNKVGCNITDFIDASIKLALYENVEFDFGNEEN